MQDLASMHGDFKPKYLSKQDAAVTIHLMLYIKPPHLCPSVSGLYLEIETTKGNSSIVASSAPAIRLEPGAPMNIHQE